MIVNQHHHHLVHNIKEKEDNQIRAPDSFYLFKAKRQNELYGQHIPYHQLIDEWNAMSKDQKAEFESQSECLQFTMDIEKKSSNHHFIPKIQLPPTTSMVIPNDHSPTMSNTMATPSTRGDDYFYHHQPYHSFTYQYHNHNNHYHHASSNSASPDATNTNHKFIPNLSYSAAAEAAALVSLSFTEKKITTSQSTKRKYGIVPEKVKRPPNAYLLFNRDMRRKLHDDHLGLSSGEISKSISQRWKQLPQEQKDYYFREESKLKQKHNNEHVNFIYTRRSKAEMKQADSLKQQSKQNKKPTTNKPPLLPKKKSLSPQTIVEGGKDPRGRKKKRADESLPKHPMSGYLHFAKKMRPIMKHEKPDARLVDISKEIGLRWRSLTPQEMQPWIDMSNQDKARYAQEMKDRIQKDALSSSAKRKFSSISSSSTTSSSSSNAAAAAVVLEELDSETIATVAQMVNPSSH